jgi:hypothetical protein
MMFNNNWSITKKMQRKHGDTSDEAILGFFSAAQMGWDGLGCWGDPTQLRAISRFSE